MAPGDKLLQYTTALEGGLYVCPTPSALQVPEAPQELPTSTWPLRHKNALTSYTTTEAFVAWMIEMRARRLFQPGPEALGAALRPDLQRFMDQIYGALDGEESNKLELLREFQRKAETEASEINETLDDYLTFN